MDKDFRLQSQAILDLFSALMKIRCEKVSEGGSERNSESAVIAHCLPRISSEIGTSGDVIPRMIKLTMEV